MTVGPVRRRRRRLRRPRWPALLIIVIIALLVVADQRGWLLVENADELSLYDGRSFPVARVIDGDTIEIDAFDPLRQRPTTTIRLWGIDCPEVAHPGSPDSEPWGDQAAEFTRQLVAGEMVTLHLEPHRLRGVYGRVLAHLDTSAGVRVNEALLDAGLARADDRWPHRDLRRYREAEQRAAAAHRGLWSDQ